MNKRIRRIGVKPGSIFKVWVEPAAGQKKEYRAVADLTKEPGSETIWSGKGTTANTKSKPAQEVLTKALGYRAIVTVIFASTDATATIFNQMCRIDKKGNEVPHGKVISRVVKPSKSNAVQDVFINVYMA